MNSATPRSTTHAFARVLGPFITIVAIIAACKASSLGGVVDAFFADPIIVWFAGAVLIFGGIFIIAFHQYWRSPTAIVISLFGWFLLLRGIAILALPQLFASAADASIINLLPIVEVGFGIMVLLGLWLTYTGWITRSEK